MSRPVVSVQLTKKRRQTALPAVFLSPIRIDIVHYVHKNVSKNDRQPHAVSKYAGHQTSAESWGTGRAVSRIPRVAGGGTHRAGQGAFGNMCRGGRMFAPTKTFRRWKRKTNLNQRRYAICSALAASAVPSLVLARGHRIERVPEIPLVVRAKTISSFQKTKQAVAFLQNVGAATELQRTKNSKRLRAGKGKMRNRRHIVATGPLIVYKNAGTIPRAFRNIPGVETCDVNYLDILQLAPGSHLGRFIIWTEDAFRDLDAIFGTPKQLSKRKVGYKPPRAILTNPHITRIMKSYEIQSVLRDTKAPKHGQKWKRNPLKNWHEMIRLNPYHAHKVRKILLKGEAQKKKRQALIEAKRKGVPVSEDTLKKQKASKQAFKASIAKRKKYYQAVFELKQHPGRQTVRLTKKERDAAAAAALASAATGAGVVADPKSSNVSSTIPPAKNTLS